MIPLLTIIAALVLGLAFMGLNRGKTIRLANEKAAPNYKKLHAEAIGISPDATDEEAETAHQEHMEAIANELGEDDAEEEGDDETAATANEAALANELAESQTALANERKRSAGLLIGNAITAGKITVADKPTWEKEFETDFDAASLKLGNVKATIKVKPRTVGLGKENSIALANESERRDLVQELIEKAKPECGGDYDKAYAKVQRENPDLFKAMKDPLKNKE